MRIARFEHAGAVGWGVVEGDELRAVAGDLGFENVFVSATGDPADLVHRTTEALALDDVRLLSPTPRPSKVICIGLNYRAHAAESKLPVPSSPMIFAKFPSSICGPDDPIRLPPISQQVDWEVELAIVIGKRARHVSEDRSLDHVAGYTVGNDISARDLQVADGQFVRAKSFDSFCPLGPWITTVDELGAADDLGISLEVGGRTMQDSRTSDMVFGVRELVSFCSSIGTLHPGDVILSGTPQGTGFGQDPPTYLRAGDDVAATIEGIGTLRNPVRLDDHA